MRSSNLSLRFDLQKTVTKVRLVVQIWLRWFCLEVKLARNFGGVGDCVHGQEERVERSKRDK